MTHTDHRPVLLCLSHLRWGFVWQRPQHLMTRAAQSYRVLFFEEAYYGAEVERPFLYRAPTQQGVEALVPHLPAGWGERRANAALADMIDDVRDELGGEPDVLWYYTPAALAFSDDVRAGVCVYDCMDQLSAFRNAPPDLVQREAELFRRADLVFCGGRSLYLDKARRHADAHLFPSSIEVEHFARARALRGERASRSRPTLGFFGVIDERLDIGLVERLARLRPDWRIEMIGPVTKIDPEILPRLPNIHWVGSIDYQNLPERLAAWDVGVMPFALNEATRFISPTKTPEFLAAGLPVVSTPIADVVTPYGEAGLVEIAADAAAFAAAVEHLSRAADESWRAQVDAFLSGTSWDMTWDEMDALMRARSRAPHMRMVRA